jgi:glycosyltransferase involved in cell wall biosynthesis
MTKDLSILIPTLPDRLDNYSGLMKELENQRERFGLKDKVQLLSLLDTKEMTVGEKRNWLLDISKAKYVQFLDDDDKVSADYLFKMQQATAYDTDVITFCGEYHESGFFHSDFLISTMVSLDCNQGGIMYRKPNHICAVRRDLAIQCRFPTKNYGEDSEYASLINNLIKTEHHINEKLYFYMFDVNKSQTHKYK